MQNSRIKNWVVVFRLDAMRILLIVICLLSSAGCHRRGVLMRGAMNIGGDMKMTGDMAMKGDVTAAIKTDNTASKLSAVPVTGGVRSHQKIAVIDVDGLLVNKNLSGLGSMGENPVALFREKLDAVAGDPSIVAVVLRINSPGGGVTASDIMSHDLESFRAKRKIPVVACLMVTGAGGAYYLATHTDKIIAHPTSVVGGIGVILNKYNLEDTMAQFNILSNPIKSGDKIDLGSPERAMEDSEQALLREMAESFHQRFIDQVKYARSDVLESEDTFDGRVFTGIQAEENHLVDRVGYLDDAVVEAQSLAGVGSGCSLVMLRRDNDRAYTALDVSPNEAASAGLLSIKLPGLDRSSMPTFMYLWQSDSSLASAAN